MTHRSHQKLSKNESAYRTKPTLVRISSSIPEQTADPLFVNSDVIVLYILIYWSVDTFQAIIIYYFYEERSTKNFVCKFKPDDHIVIAWIWTTQERSISARQDALLRHHQY